MLISANRECPPYSGTVTQLSPQAFQGVKTHRWCCSARGGNSLRQKAAGFRWGRCLGAHPLQLWGLFQMNVKWVGPVVRFMENYFRSPVLSPVTCWKDDMIISMPGCISMFNCKRKCKYKKPPKKKKNQPQIYGFISYSKANTIIIPTQVNTPSCPSTQTLAASGPITTPLPQR